MIENKRLLIEEKEEKGWSWASAVLKPEDGEPIPYSVQLPDGSQIFAFPNHFQAATLPGLYHQLKKIISLDYVASLGHSDTLGTSNTPIKMLGWR